MHVTSECGAPCQAVNCGCIGAWHVCPQKDGDSIAVQRALAGEQDDDDVDGGQRDDGQRVRRVVGLRKSKTGQSRAASDGAAGAGASSHIPSGMSSSPSTNNAGDGDEDDQARVRVARTVRERRQ